MGFFDSTAGRVGLGLLTGGISEVYRAAQDSVTSDFDPMGRSPQFVSQEYLQGLENQATSAQNRPSTSSFAEALLKAQTDEQLKQSMALASSTRGQVNPALLQRNIMMNQSMNNQAAAQSAGLVRSKEELANRQLNDELALRYRQMGLDAASKQAQANLGTLGMAANIDQSNTAARGQLLGSVINAGGGIAGKVATGGMAKGGVVPGKAEVEGDSYKNDKVHTMLSPGEIVVPRSKAKDPEMAKEFIDELKGMKSKSQKGEPASFAKILETQREIAKKIAAIEKKLGKKKD